MADSALQNESGYSDDCRRKIVSLDLSNVLHMSSGVSKTSYALNSSRQGSVFKALQPLFSELIVHTLHVEKLSDLIRIADLGCATGMNTVSEVDFVIQSVKSLCSCRSLPIPELQVFYNDLPTNDFNNLFNLLKCQEKNYFAAGVPGSFYDVLFPRSSIDICFSVMALHWLSRVPAAAEQQNSLAFNRGKVWINRTKSEDVAQAYVAQSQSDLRRFFHCRAQEMTRGGVMFLCAMGRPNSQPASHQVDADGEYCGPDFEAAWDDLISEGIVNAEVRDSFNLPWYFPSAEEMRRAIEETSEFEIKTLEVVIGVPCMSEEEFEKWVCDVESFGKQKSDLVRSFIGSLVEHTIGSEKADIFFCRLQKKASELLEKGIIRPSRYVTCTLAALNKT